MKKAGAVLCILIVSISLNSCALPPPLELEKEGSITVVGFETLGEYPSTVKRIRVSKNSTDETVWEVRALEPGSQLWSIKLRCGENEKDLVVPARGTYEVVVPKAARFVLESEALYLLEAWGESGRPVQVRFSACEKD